MSHFRLANFACFLVQNHAVNARSMWRLDRSHVGIIRHSATEAIPMIEARDEQPLLSSSGIGNGPPPTSPDKSRRKNKRRLKGEASVSPIMNSGQYYNATSSSSSTPQSVEPYSEYTRPLSATFPLQQPNTNNASNANGNGGVISPLTAGGLPPAIPMRSRINSSGDRSIGELSTVSGASGHARSRSIGGGRSRSPKPHRSRSSFSGGVTANGGPPPRSRSPPNVGMMNMNAQPLHQRRSSDEYSSNRYQRSNSYDMRDQQQQQQTLLVRGMSSNSLYSMNSATGSVHSETLRLLPDPRWGGGSGHNRVRSFSSGSGQALLRGSNHANMQYSSSGSSPRVNISNISYSTDSMEGKQQQPFGGINYGGHYGSISSFGTKEIIPPMNMATRQHRRTHSEVSAASFASAVSIDKSVEPVMTNMTKSSMFKGVTNEGVVKMQLPKDNFRLLSDRDLGEYIFVPRVS